MKIKVLIILLSGAVLLYSCQGSSNYKAMDNESSDTALVSADSTAPNQAKLVKTAGMSFKVKDVAQTCEQISGLTRQYRGMVMHHHMKSYIERSSEMRLSTDSVMKVSAFSTAADMTVKVPSEKLDEFMNKVGRMGIYVNVRNMDIEDKSLIYLESQLKLNSRKELISQQDKGRIKLEHPEDVLIFKDGLVDEQINNRRIDDGVKYSMVDLTFSQNNTVAKEIMANDDPSEYKMPFFSRLAMAVIAGFNLFAELVIALAHLWVFMVVGILLWIGIAQYRRRHPSFPKTNPFAQGKLS